MSAGPSPAEAPPQSHGARTATWLALGAAGLLAGLLIWLILRPVPRDTRAISWEDLAPPMATALRPCTHIIIHHSATRRDSLESIDAWHRKRGWDGIGYDFLVGNGEASPLGRIEATFRWRLQREGAHAGAGPEQQPFNQYGIGVCLIGNFDLGPPDPWQEERLADLCAELLRHIPTLSLGRIIGHRDVPGKETRCPGTQFDLDRIRYLVRQKLEQR